MPWWTPSPSKAWRATLGAVVLSGVALSFGAAQAALPDTAEQMARAEMGQAQTAYDTGEFDQALAHYAEAYRLKPLPGFLFNLAQCHRQLGRHERAAFFYQRFLDLAPEAANADQARDLLREMRRRQADDDRRRKLDTDRAYRRAQLQASSSASPGNSKPREPYLPGAGSPSTSTVTAERRGLTTRWWFWTGVGVVALGAGAAVYVATAPRPATPTLGTVNER